MLCTLRYKAPMARKPRVPTKSSSLIVSPQELVRYLNQPPQQTDLYSAIRAIARYFAGAEDLRFLNTAAAMIAIQEAANRAMDGLRRCQPCNDLKMRRGGSEVERSRPISFSSVDGFTLRSQRLDL